MSFGLDKLFITPERERELVAESLDKVGGRAEICTLLNEPMHQVRRWIERRESNNFPLPIKILGQGLHLYYLPQVLTWYHSYYATRKHP